MSVSSPRAPMRSKFLVPQLTAIFDENRELLTAFDIDLTFKMQQDYNEALLGRHMPFESYADIARRCAEVNAEQNAYDIAKGVRVKAGLAPKIEETLQEIGIKRSKSAVQNDAVRHAAILTEIVGQKGILLTPQLLGYAYAGLHPWDALANNYYTPYVIE